MTRYTKGRVARDPIPGVKPRGQAQGCLMGQKWGFYPHFWGPRGDPPGDPIFDPKRGIFGPPGGSPRRGPKWGPGPSKIPQIWTKPVFCYPLLALFWRKSVFDIGGGGPRGTPLGPPRGPILGPKWGPPGEASPGGPGGRGDPLPPGPWISCH